MTDSETLQLIQVLADTMRLHQEAQRNLREAVGNLTTLVADLYKRIEFLEMVTK